jgi:hypothetical protein
MTARTGVVTIRRSELVDWSTYICRDSNVLSLGRSVGGSPCCCPSKQMVEKEDDPGYQYDHSEERDD